MPWEAVSHHHRMEDSLIANSTTVALVDQADPADQDRDLGLTVAAVE